MISLENIPETFFTIIFGVLGLIFFGIIFGLLYKGIDRKLSAHMQGRIGPPIRQPFRDVVKLFTKENIVPENSIPWIFNLAPLAGLIATITILLYIPIGGFEPLVTSQGDLILILYLLIIPSLAMVIGGFASGSPYATVGAQREMATMIGYEFPLAIIIVTFAWIFGSKTVGLLDPSLGPSNSFALATITSTPIWGSVGILGFIGVITLLLVLLLVTPAELSKIPFDTPEAETEIAGGLLAEYSGRNLGMFYLTDAVKTVVMASLIVALFFPYNLSTIFGLTSYTAMIIDFIFFLIKVLIIIVFSVTLVRVAIARLKIDQVVYTYWVWFTLLALVGLILIMWDRQLAFPTVASWLGF
jgi:formate hydrogenlyase subunit 4